jgi:fatty-acyl-CoA synthase
MLGSMMNRPLLIAPLLKHAARWNGGQEIVSRRCEGDIHRYTYADAYRRVGQLAHALSDFGIVLGDRVATLAWNTYRHLELYFGVSGIGAVCHTINPRLFPDQIAYIINHAQDRILCLDLTFVPLMEKLAAHCPKIEAYVILTDRAHMPETSLPNALSYEEWIASRPESFDWPDFPETTASSLCYTSGTTGNPKGVLYTHRSSVLHSYGIAMPDVFNVSRSSCILPAVPMFHVNAWGVPYMAPLIGAKLVLPGPALAGAPMAELIATEGVSLLAGVPTIWRMLLDHLKATGQRLDGVDRVVIGGAACPPGMIQEFDDLGTYVLHAWGMTETSPLGTANNLTPEEHALPQDQRTARQVKQGRPVSGVDLRITGTEGEDLPHDGKAFGDLWIQGHWIASSYFGRDDDPAFKDGWFMTGDVATIDPEGRMQIVDRSKDVIKSGGEWISTIELENIAASMPGIAEAAVVGLKHPKWDERPLLLCVRKEGSTATKEQVLAGYEGRIAKWWLPDDVVFVEGLPHTATGKLLKTKLREEFSSYYFDTVGAV